MRYELWIALRYIRSRRRGPVSLITLITIGGVAMGVSALTVVTSVWNGFEAEFLEKLLGINAHAVILRTQDVFREHLEAAELLRKDPGIEFVQPFVYSEVIAQSEKGVMGVAIKGIDPTLAKTTALGKYASAEAFLRLEADANLPRSPALDPEGTNEPPKLPGIFIGKELQESLHVDPGETVTIVSPYGSDSGQPRTQRFEVAAVFHSGMYEFDARMVFIELGQAQRLFRLYRTVTGLEVWSKDPMKSNQIVPPAVRALELSTGEAYDVRDWTRTNRGLFGAVRSQKALISLVLFAIIIVASFNIVSTLILLILEKGREIAVLKALGASDRAILTIFVIDGQIIGLVGCTLGILFGLLICMGLQEYGLKLDPRVYYLEHLPIVVRPLEVALVAMGAMTAATLATIFPAKKAAALPPVDGLRQGGGLRRSTSAARTKPAEG